MSSKSDITFHYCILRSDLDRGQSDAQLGHAAGYSASQYTYQTKELLPEHTHFIALVVPNEEGLLQLEQILLKANIAHVAVREPDPPLNGQLAAIGVIPCLRKEVSSYLSRLPITKERPCPKCAVAPALHDSALRHDGATPNTGNNINGSQA